MKLLFTLAYWHGLAGLHMHTEETAKLLDSLTTVLGQRLREFKSTTCEKYITREFKRETEKRLQQSAKAAAKTEKGKNGAAKGNDAVTEGQDIVRKGKAPGMKGKAPSAKAKKPRTKQKGESGEASRPWLRQTGVWTYGTLIFVHRHLVSFRPILIAPVLSSPTRIALIRTRGGRHFHYRTLAS